MTPDEIRKLNAVVPVWPDVGKIYAIGRTTAYDLAARGALPVPVRKIGSSLRVRRSDILIDLGIFDISRDQVCSWLRDHGYTTMAEELERRCHTEGEKTHE